MDVLRVPWEFGARHGPLVTLAQVEWFSVAATMVVYGCLLAIANGIRQRGSSAGVPLRNFLAGVLMTSLAFAFADPAAPVGPAYVQMVCGIASQLCVCACVLLYSDDIHRDVRLSAAAGVLFSVLANMRGHELSVMTAWSAVNLVLLPGLDLVRARRAGVSTPADALMVTLSVSGTLSLLGWGTFIFMAGAQLLAGVHFAGAVLAAESLRDMYTNGSDKLKKA